MARPLARCVFAELVPDAVLHVVVPPGGGDFGEIATQRAGAFVNGDAVVVEDDEDIAVGDAGVVQAFEGQAAGHGTVADDGDVLAFGFAPEFGGHGHAEGGGNGGGGMAGRESVVFALERGRKTAQAVQGPDRGETVAPSGQDFVRIGLMADIPDDAVVGCVENVMQGYGQFHDAERGTQMAGMVGHDLNDVGAQFLCQRGERIGGQFTQVFRPPDVFKQVFHGEFL